MSRVAVINALALYVPSDQYKRTDFLKMETDVLKDLLVCYLNPRAKLPERSKTVIMRLAEPKRLSVTITGWGGGGNAGGGGGRSGKPTRVAVAKKKKK